MTDQPCVLLINSSLNHWETKYTVIMTDIVPTDQIYKRWQRCGTNGLILHLK